MKADVFWATLFVVVLVLTAVLVIALPAGADPAGPSRVHPLTNTFAVTASSTSVAPGTPVTFNGTTTGGPGEPSIIKYIAVGQNGGYDSQPAYDPADGLIVTGNYEGQNLSFISDTTNRVTSNPWSCNYCDPYSVIYDSHAAKFFIANDDNPVTAVMDSSGNVDQTVTGPGNMSGTGNHALAYDSVDHTIWVSADGASGLYYFNDLTYATGGPVGLSAQSWGIAYDPIEDEIFAGTLSNDKVAVINASTHAATATIAITSPPAWVSYGMAWDSGTNTIWVAGSSGVIAINPLTNTYTAVSGASGGQYDHVTYDPNTGEIFNSVTGTDTIQILCDGSSSCGGTLAVIGSISDSYPPSGGVFDSSNGNIYVVSNLGASAGEVAVVGVPVGSSTYNFGDGQTATGRNPTHTYSSPGTYTVEAWWNWTGTQVESAPVTITVSSGKAQGSTTISGFVNNETSGDPIPTAKVLTSLGNYTTVNVQGYYSLTILDSYKSVQVCAYAEAYQTLCQNVTLTGAGVSLNFNLLPSGLTPVGGLTGVTIEGPLDVAVGSSAQYTANVTCRGGCTYPSYLYYGWTVSNANANVTAGSTSATVTIKGMHAGPETVSVQVFQLSTGTTVWYNLHVNVTSAGSGGGVVFLGISQTEWIEGAVILLLVALALIVVDALRKKGR